MPYVQSMCWRAPSEWQAQIAATDRSATGHCAGFWSVCLKSTALVCFSAPALSHYVEREEGRPLSLPVPMRRKMHNLTACTWRAIASVMTCAGGCTYTNTGTHTVMHTHFPTISLFFTNRVYYTEILYKLVSHKVLF